MLYNLEEYNADYHKDGTLVFKKIGEKLGKRRIRKKKNYCSIGIEKIIVEPYVIDENLKNEAKKFFNETGQIVPVYISYDFKLISGFEFYELAKELGHTHIFFIRNTKLNHRENCEFKKSVQRRKVGNKKYPVRINDGGYVYLSLKHYKKHDELQKLARKAGLKLDISPEYKFRILGLGDNYYSLKTVKNKIEKYIRECDC